MICHNLINILADITPYLSRLIEFILGVAGSILSNMIFDRIKKRGILMAEAKKNDILRFSLC